MNRTRLFRLARRTALTAACAASLIPLMSRGDSGVIRFSGAITEPVCNTTATPTNNARGLRLNMNCNTDQSVQVGYENISDVAQQQALSYAGRTLREGEQLPLALKGRQDNQIDLAIARPAQAQAGVPMLLTMTYR